VKDVESAAGKKVYLPYSKFLQLWNLAHPDRKIEEERAPADLVLGNAHYVLRIEERCSGSRGSLKSTSSPTDGSRSASLRALANRRDPARRNRDGVAAGFPGSSVPVIEVKGRRPRKLEIELVAPSTGAPGSTRC